jgi:threonine dehydrogenase-like Zn-dependent dehydrogenase
METALNAVWDSGAGPGDRIAIVGGGILGGLLAGILGAMPGADVTLVDVEPTRTGLADHMNVSFSLPENAPKECDVVFHTSCTGAGAATALSCGGLEARIIEMSWFGDALPPLPLGGAFHSRRLQYVSSQVGQVAPSRRPRWSYARRMAKALDLLRDPRYDALITGEVAFDDLPAMLPDILAPGAAGLATAIKYGE